MTIRKMMDGCRWYCLKIAWDSGSAVLVPALKSRNLAKHYRNCCAASIWVCLRGTDLVRTGAELVTAF